MLNAASADLAVFAGKEFDAFGNGGANEYSRMGYAGEYHDAETGFIYLRARYYNPAIGRFINEDPIRDGLNWYVYANNNPVNFVDPSGNFVITVGASLGLSSFFASYGAYIVAGIVGIFTGAAISYEINKTTISEPVTITSEPLVTPYPEGKDTSPVTTISSADAQITDTSTTITQEEAPHSLPTFIYRSGSGSAKNLTPREIKDINGLSYSLTPPSEGNYTITTIEAVNDTQVLCAIKDGPNHVSVFPADMNQMQAWIASRETAETNPHPYTVLLQIISVKAKGDR